MDESLRLKPGNAFAWRARGEAKLRLNQFAEAIVDLGESLRLKPGNAIALRARGEAKRCLKQFAEAIIDLDESLRLEPGNAVALRLLEQAKQQVHEQRKLPLSHHCFLHSNKRSSDEDDEDANPRPQKKLGYE